MSTAEQRTIRMKYSRIDNAKGTLGPRGNQLEIMEHDVAVFYTLLMYDALERKDESAQYGS